VPNRWGQIAVCLGWLLCSIPGGAQDVDGGRPADVDRMVRDGMVEALKSRFRGGRTAEELRLIAEAQTSKAARAKDDERRQRDFEEAARRYLIWIGFIEHDRDLERVQRTVDAG
jgi:hypothetical protein